MFQKRAFGLDVADHTVEFVELLKNPFSGRISLSVRARISLEYGLVVGGKLMNKKKFSESLNNLWKKSGRTVKHIMFGLPERQVYTSLLSFDQTAPSWDMIQSRVFETLPIEKDDLAFSVEPLSQTSFRGTFLAWGASKEIINEWRDFFESVGITVSAFDNELLAIERGLFGKHPLKPCCVVDIGAERTKIMIFSKQGLAYVHALDVAGDVFTAEIAKALELSKEEAEKLKRESGMNPVNVYPLFVTLLADIVREAQNGVNNFSQENQEGVEQVILVGGSARLLGLVEYLNEQLKLPVKLGTSFLLDKNSDNDSERLHYIEAIGLALRGLDKEWDKTQPSLT